MIITAGKFKGRKIVAPDEKITRPTLSKVRMSVFNTLQSMVEFDGASFLDMFAGSGIMGLEALSRGFLKVVAIEKNPKSAKVIRENYNMCHCEGAKRPSQSYYNEITTSLTAFTPRNDNIFSILLGDSLKIVPKLDENFDVIYIDPPYFSGIYEKSLEAVKDITSNIVILEHVTDVDFGDFEILKQKKYGDKFITFLHLFRSTDG